MMCKLYLQNKEKIHYLICGGLTTIVNLCVYWLAAKIIILPTGYATGLAWLAAVVFAYFVNREFVFESNHNAIEEKMKEMAAFFTARIGSGILEVGLMILFVDCLGCMEILMKICVGVLVTILNYVASKRIIFGGGTCYGEKAIYSK